ncbi:MAG TPA: glucosamine-6-phosphate deaminase [Vicinamibacterales bacterium]|nr:glucosamine-6-phosphate deaminase [Vicinamibacterales bacterium]
MNLSVYPTEKVAAAAVARQIAARVAEQPELVLGLPTGRTPVPLYNEIGALFASHAIDLSRVTTFNLDEFVGIPPEHPGSYHAFMRRHLFARVNVPEERANFLNGLAPNLHAECARYEHAIAAAGGIDLQLLGIGTNGHIGFNEPARELAARTHKVTLHESTRRANASLFGNDLAQVPCEALSMGMGTILAARSIVLLAMGKSKARCIERVVNGPITTRLPASFLQLHPRVELVLDEGAASSLSN